MSTMKLTAKQRAELRAEMDKIDAQKKAGTFGKEDDYKEWMREDTSAGNFGENLKKAWGETKKEFAYRGEQAKKALKIGKYGWVGSLTKKK